MELIKLTLPDLSQVDFQIAFVNDPATESTFQAFQKTVTHKFVEVDKAQRKVMGYFMIADKEIPRWDAQRGAYKVIFPKESIDVIVKNFSINGLNRNMNEMHQTNQFAKGTYVLNHWQLNSKLGIGAPSGFKTEADGSWIGMVQCDNDEIYQKCLDGTYTGFSIESMFIEEKLGAMAELDAFLKGLM